MNNRYVVVTVDSVYSHEIREGEKSVFPQPYDIRMVVDAGVELLNQIEIVEGQRSIGDVFCYEISSYDRNHPDRGWLIESYDRDGNPYQLIKCIKV